MKLLKLQNIRHESGHCYVADLSGTTYPGECVGSAHRSSARLFEDGNGLGPSHASHQDIRSVGGGRFSHWEGLIFFSTSDNSNPVRNRRNYSVAVFDSLAEEVESEQILAARFANRPTSLRIVLSQAMGSQGSELHSVYTFRALLMHCKNAGISLEGVTCLEIGASQTSGMAISVGMAGARRLFLNNIEEIARDIDINFAKTVAFLTSLVVPPVRTLEQVVDFSPDGRTCRLKQSLFSIHDRCDALELADKVSGVDFMFSFSVLEHIRHLTEVLAALKQCATPQCRAIHVVDARDHTDFNDPLKYLRLPEEEFMRTYSSAHNRTRFSGYMLAFQQAGWHVELTRYLGLLPVLESGSTDMLSAGEAGPEALLHDSPEELPQLLDQKATMELQPEFRNGQPEDLRILGFAATLSLAK